MNIRIPYNSTLCPEIELLGAPPYTYSGATLIVFPLQANPIRVKEFLDSSLNLIPQEVANFLPAAPFVLMTVLTGGEIAQVSGRFSGIQTVNQVGFAIPVAEYRRHRGRSRLVDFGLFFPFSFLDNPASVWQARRVLGWASTLGGSQATIQLWPRDPDSPRSMMTLDTEVVPNMWQGEAPRPGRLIEVQLDVRNPVQWPPLLGAPGSPLRKIPDLVEGSARAFNPLRQTLNWSISSGQLGFPLATDLVSALARVMSRGIQNLFRGPSPSWHSIFRTNVFSLKQFRDIEKSTRICYQGVLRTRMPVLRVSKIGLLGASANAGGDPSGGFRIRVGVFESHAICSLLGLEVARYERGRNPEKKPFSQVTYGIDHNTDVERLPAPEMAPHRHPWKSSVAILEPLAPFWMEVDMRYDASEVLTWRLRDTGWLIETPQFLSESGAAIQVTGAPALSQLGLPDPGGNFYNTSLGGIAPTVDGPFVFSDVTLRILPLKACEDTLQSFTDRFLNINPDHRFKVHLGYVFMIAADFGSMASLSENTANWASREISFIYIVRRCPRGSKPIESPQQDLFLVAPFIFSDSEIGAITASEIEGFNVLLASVHSPANAWMRSDGPVASSSLLRLWWYANPAVTLAAEPRNSVLIEVLRRRKNGEVRQAAPSQPHRSSSTEDETRPDNVICNALSGHGFRFINLKQFRDGGLFLEACYQALVQVNRCIHGKLEPRPITDKLEVRIQMNPALRIVRMLGIKRKLLEVDKSRELDRAFQGNAVAVMEAECPFWIFASLVETRPGEVLAWRAAGSADWQKGNELRLGNPVAFL